MQVAVAAFFLLQVVFSLVVSAVYINHDSMLRVLQAQNSIPQGTDLSTVVSVSIFFAWAVTLVFSALELVAAAGSYLGWRWVFWAALVLLGLGAIGAITNLGALRNPASSPVPTWAVAAGEVLAIASLGLFVWMLVGAIRFGPWAMKRPGH